MNYITSEEIFSHTGKYLGYPDCCIEGFILLYNTGGAEPRKLNGTGYVPCLKCNKLTEEELIFNINEKRRCPIAFPDA